jgi:hypothetical protein
MKMNQVLIFILALFANLAFVVEGWGTTGLTIQFDASVRGNSVSPLLYVIFLEDNNHSITGGLYGEMLRNRSFEDADTPLEFLPPLAKVYRKDSTEGWRSVVDGSGVMFLDRLTIECTEPTRLRCALESQNPVMVQNSISAYTPVPPCDSGEDRG